jgi:hypothetical protein
MRGKLPIAPALQRLRLLLTHVSGSTTIAALETLLSHTQLLERVQGPIGEFVKWACSSSATVDVPE